MKKLIISVAVLALVGCATVEQDVPPATPAPIEEVVVEEIDQEEKEKKDNSPRSRAKKLLRVIFGGMNK